MAFFSNGRWSGGALALALVLVAGCSSPKPSPHDGDSVASPKKTNALTKKEARDATNAVARAHAHYATALIHDMNGESEEALNDFLLAAKEDFRNEELTLEISRRCIEAKRPEKALELLTNFVAHTKASGEIYARLGLVYAQVGNTNLAIAADNQAIRRSPKSITGYRNLFALYYETKRYADAHNILGQALNQTGTSAEFLVDLAALILAQDHRAAPTIGDTKTNALIALTRAAALKPSDPDLRLKLADGLNVLGESEKALPIYLDLLREFPNSLVVRTGVRAKVLEIYLRGKDHARASEQVEAMLRDDPSNVQAYYLLGEIAHEDKKPDKAAEYFSKALLFDPGFEPAYYSLAQAQLNQNKGTEALDTIRRAKSRFGDNYLGEMLAAFAQRMGTNFSGAIEALTAAEVFALAADTNQLSDLYFQFGVTYERKGDFDQAAKYFEKCLERAPDFAEALNYLGYMWADRGENLQRARELIEKAVKQEPKNGAFLDSLGWVLFKLGEPEKALGYIQQAIDVIEAPDPTLFDHMGDILAALKQPEKALDAWRKSVALEPNEKIEKKIAGSASK